MQQKNILLINNSINLINNSTNLTILIKYFFNQFNFFMKSTHFVYLLKCSDDTLYCGYTNNLEKRVEAHNKGKGSKYTRGRLPTKLIYVEECSSKSIALKREWEIKKLSRREKLLLIKK